MIHCRGLLFFFTYAQLTQVIKHFISNEDVGGKITISWYSILLKNVNLDDDNANTLNSTKWQSPIAVSMHSSFLQFPIRCSFHDYYYYYYYNIFAFYIRKFEMHISSAAKCLHLLCSCATSC